MVTYLHCAEALLLGWLKIGSKVIIVICDEDRVQLEGEVEAWRRALKKREITVRQYYGNMESESLGRIDICVQCVSVCFITMQKTSCYRILLGRSRMGNIYP